MRREVNKNQRKTLAEKQNDAIKRRYGSEYRGLTPRQISEVVNEKNKKKKQRTVINGKKGLTRGRKQVVVRTHPVALPSSVPLPFDVPGWFMSRPEVDVSVIVPMFKSDSAIRAQIASWTFDDDGLTKEVIYVDDKCPNGSAEAVIEAWTERRASSGKISHIGKVIKNKNNLGFSGACNVGAASASGKYLVFLNADCTVTPDWIKPMIDLLEQDKGIGLVGNMQIKEGFIDSAGSEWSWQEKQFAHIGRNIYKGQRIHKFALNKVPPDLMVPQEREMVTGCCFAIRRELFHDLQGFDTNFRVGYWEDADICLRVRANGYKVFYQPQSRITHEVGHSKSGGHEFRDDNRRFFFDRWVRTGRLDRMVSAERTNKPSMDIKQHIDGKVVGCVIACNEEEFLEASVRSASQMVHEWIFVVGGNQYAHEAGMCTRHGHPTDGTLDIARSLAKKYNGTVIEPPGRCWHDKVEMRNQYASKLNPGDWMFMLDGDEVYKPNQLWRLVELMRDHECLILQFWLFWNNLETIGTGVWDNFIQERVVKWQKGYEYAGKNHLHVSLQGKNICSNVKTWRSQKERLFYHYSWVRPIEKIRQKIEYYRHQTGRYKPNYVDDFFLRFRTDPQSVQGHTHPFGGGGFAPFPGIHPVEIRELIEQGKLNFK